MKNLLFIIIVILYAEFLSCKATRTFKKAISTSKELANQNKVIEDSIRNVNEQFRQFKSNNIDFETFNAKIKVESVGSNGKNPDLMAVVRIIKDSAIWMSLSATILNVEVYRLLITRDSVILVNKQDKEVMYRSLAYLQEVTQIPFDFKTIENLIVGNPVYMSDKILSYKAKDNMLFYTSMDSLFKNLLTISVDQKLLVRSKLDDIDINRNRTADIYYDGYVANNGKFFSTDRHITISEKNKLDIKLGFKQFDFNNQTSLTFHVPKNYKIK